MKIIVCKTNGKNHIKDLGDLNPKDFWEVNAVLHEEVGGFFKIVRPKGLQQPYVMICNEAGILMQLPFNLIASSLYGTPEHDAPILGNVVIMKEEDECLTGLDDEEARKMKCTFDILMAIADKHKRKRGDKK